VLVASADGVGTKLKVATAVGRHDTVGEDLVNHCVNDILVQGAVPLFFLDYFATDRLDPAVMADVVQGIARGCRNNGAALLGGETAELPGIYATGEYDVAGTIIGVVERKRIIDGSRITAGDVLLALPSSGLHTNGYSLARKALFEVAGLAPTDTPPELDRPVGEALLAVHRSYLEPLREPLAAELIKGLAHITGGGITENLPRILPEGIGAHVDRSTWQPPPLFQLIARHGGVEADEMYRTFNMGVGMIAVTSPENAGRLEAQLDEAFRIGEIVAGERRVSWRS